MHQIDWSYISYGTDCISCVIIYYYSMLFSAWNWSKTCHICINWAWVIIWTEITSPIIWSEDVLTISKPTPPPRKYIGLRIYCNSDLIYISFKIQRQQLDIKSVYFWCGWARGFVLFPIEELQQYCMLLLAKLFKKIPRKIFLRYFDKTTFGDVHWNRFKKNFVKHYIWREKASGSLIILKYIQILN